MTSRFQEHINNILHPEQFKYETRIKGKPNSQGTLFQVKPGQRTPESRQPRGYSPERYKAVGDATGMQRKNSSMHVYGGHAETMAKGWADLARSTVPMSDLTRPDKSAPASGDNPDLHIGVTTQSDTRAGGIAEGVTAAGFYNEPGSTAIPNEGRIALVTGRYAPSVVVHEVGHHVDYKTTGIPYGTPAEKGRAEGFADAYADKHARTAGYKQKQERPDTRPDRPYDWGDKQDPVQFKVSYNNERYGNPHGMLQPDQFGLGKDLPKNHVPGQLPLLHKQFRSVWPGETPGPAQWKYV